MKHILIIFGFFIQLTAFGQSYQLAPDSCTFCFYGGAISANSSYNNTYGIHPSSDTVLFGNTYMLLSGLDTILQPFAIRQTGNKLYGIVQDSTNEVLIMDFDAVVGDTIFNLYSEGYRYNAIVYMKDSFLVNNGIYHHYMRLGGYQILINGNWVSNNWDIKWNERGLCLPDITGFDWEYGGVFYNIPYHEFVTHVPYIAPSYCTTDPTYDNQYGNTCINCQPISATDSIEELDMGEHKKLIRIVNILGQEIEEEANKVLFYIYSDGTTKKVFRVE